MVLGKRYVCVGGNDSVGGCVGGGIKSEGWSVGKCGFKQVYDGKQRVVLLGRMSDTVGANRRFDNGGGVVSKRTLFCLILFFL